jgi:hypothetical protein
MSNFRLPADLHRGTPLSRRRRASASVCASVRVRPRSAGPSSGAGAGPWPGSSPTGGHWPAPSARRRLVRGQQQVGPDLGFHQHAHRGPVAAQEAPHRARGVVGQPGLRVAGLQQRAPGLAAGGGAVGQQQLHAGAWRRSASTRVCGGAGLAQRHGMDPHLRPGCAGAVEQAQALVPGRAVQRFARRATTAARSRPAPAGAAASE